MIVHGLEEVNVETNGEFITYELKHDTYIHDEAILRKTNDYRKLSCKRPV